jgi:hypothetical protein
MQPGLLFLLRCLVLVAAVTGYFGFVRPPRLWPWHPQAACIVTTFLLIPFVSWLLFLQAGAPSRLSRLGVQPHPALTSSVGLAVGLGAHPTFLFRSAADPDALLSFYRLESGHFGWALVEDAPTSLILERGSERVIIIVTANGTQADITYQFVSAGPPNQPQARASTLQKKLFSRKRGQSPFSLPCHGRLRRVGRDTSFSSAFRFPLTCARIRGHRSLCSAVVIRKSAIGMACKGSMP